MSAGTRPWVSRPLWARSWLNSSRYSARSRRRAVIFGASERAKAGRQHSSRMVSWARSTQPFELGLPALMRHWRARSASTGAAELARGELGAVIGRHLAELPAGRLEL